MEDERYAQVDEHLEGLFGPPDAVLTQAQRRAEDAGIPSISVSPAIGRFLHVLALTRGARRILEIGTLAGYSTIWLARALPADGHLVTLEYEPVHAEVARANLASAGLSDQVEVRVGRATDLLAELTTEGADPFDLVFIDADKPPYTEYLDASLALSRPGTLIVADNVVRGGKVAMGPSDDPAVTGVQRFSEALAAHPAVTACFVQQVGVKGYDGMALAVVRDVGDRDVS
jgi:caffeoyl-CoA O-methyltransferase